MHLFDPDPYTTGRPSDRKPRLPEVDTRPVGLVGDGWTVMAGVNRHSTWPDAHLIDEVDHHGAAVTLCNERGRRVQVEDPGFVVRCCRRCAGIAALRLAQQPPQVPQAPEQPQEAAG